jgi:hypothetical protein
MRCLPENWATIFKKWKLLSMRVVNLEAFLQLLIITLFPPRNK